MKAIIGARYRHYKGNEYSVIAIAKDEADPSRELVIYRAEYDAPDVGYGCVWARERGLFEGVLDVDGREVERFTQVTLT